MGDEVKRKPTKEQKRSRKNPPATEKGYYDILLLGRAGRGKSSTADKLMVLNSPLDLQIGKGDATQASTEPINPAPKSDKRKIEGASASNHGRLTEATDVGSDDHRVKIQYENLTGWVSSDELEEHDRADTRLKNIVFCRAISDPPSHEQIDKLRKEKDYAKVYESTNNCMLMTNDATMIQVLDTPGFYSPDLQGGATNEVDSNLVIVRRIIQMQTLAGLQIRRVLYFLPDCGPLTRSDRVLQGEISCMVKYFDKSIFSRMVLVGTVPANFSKSKKMEDEDKFSKVDLDENRELFYTTLEREFKERKENYTDLPKPPIIFIAMTDTCEEILVKIMTAPVQNNDSLTVQFRSNQCCRCPAEISDKDGEKFSCTQRVCSGGDITVPYEDSTCHPAMLPMYTARSVLTGIAKIMLFKWHFTEERCFNSKCRLPLGSTGCKKIGTMHEEDGYEPICVDHSDNVNDKVVKKKIAKTIIQ